MIYNNNQYYIRIIHHIDYKKYRDVQILFDK